MAGGDFALLLLALLALAAGAAGFRACAAAYFEAPGRPAGAGLSAAWFAARKNSPPR